MKSKVVVLAVVGLGVVALWVGLWWGVWKLAQSLPQEDVSAAGPLGDMFGASTALFSGLGFLGLAMALAYDAHKRAESRRPFIQLAVPHQNDVADPARVTVAGYDGALFRVEAILELVLSNESSDVALNVEVESTMEGLSTSADPIALPVARGREDKVTVRLSGSGAAVAEIFRSISRGEACQIQLSASYEALNGAKWATKVTFELRADTQAAQDKLSSALLRGGGEPIRDTGGRFGSPNFASLKCEPVAGSWSQSAI